MNVIALNDVKKTFPKSNFLLDLPNLQIPQGYITGFIGRNGAGKTTTLKLIMDMLKPDVGTVTVFGLDTVHDSARIKNDIGYIGDQNGYLEHARLHVQIKMLRPFFAQWDDTLFAHYIERFSINLNQRHKELSKGQQKQFALAVALSHHPKLLLMDEPTANLDPLVRQELLDILMDEMQQEGLSIFFSTHITSDLDKIADYVQFLQDGHILLAGEKDTLMEGHRMVKGRSELFTPEIRQLFISGQQSEFGFTGLTNQTATLYELLGQEAVYEKPTIEDIFLCYTKKERGVIL